MSTLLSLKLPVPERVVAISDSEGFAVRGLSPVQVIGLYKRHAGELEPMFQRILAGVKQTGQAEPTHVEPVVLALLADTPVILAELIVLGSGGDPSDPVGFETALDIAKDLPFTVQVDALAKIGELTFTSDMPPGKFFALVATLARKVTGAMQGLNSLAASQNGSGESVAPSIS